MKKLMENNEKLNSKIRNKMFDKIEKCRLDLQKDPTNPELHVRLGDLYVQWHLYIFNAGQYIDEAITEYQLAMESLIDSHEIYYKLGVAFYHKGELDKAINYLTMALEKKNNYYDAYNMALNYIEIKLRNRKEIVEYLKKKDFNNKCIDYALERLDKLNLLDDKRYTEAFINDKMLLSNDGPFKIRKQLIDVEINEEVIDNYLSLIDEEVWKNKLEKLINKKKSIMKSKSYYMFITKMKNDLYNLGYDKYMIDELLSNIEYSSDALSKDFLKASRKFKGDKNKIVSSLSGEYCPILNT